MDSRTFYIIDEHSIVDKWIMEFFDNLPTCIQGGVDPQAPFQLNLSKISGLNGDLKEYYEKQVSTLNSFKEVESLNSNPNNEEDNENQDREHRITINISNFANIFLLIIKIIATLKSGSLVVGSSTFDSLLDLLAGGVLLYAHRCMKDVDIYKYPTRKFRVQPVGITVFATLMTTLGLLVLFNAGKQLFGDGPSENMNLEKLLALYVIMVTTTVIKLGLWIYCRNYGNAIVQPFVKVRSFIT
ncbi:hypothetical protein POM88_019154 [Heracleum sosnowskyi]|uniref:Cation efflux protein transmembrane domain-containing protein n=1 Tax=Heracleum sosnowskyi TaxID=360622 RepID=A0AAD8MZW0_9APIA|nr:hypothetical protein POM88_019154 [Heracleum sosnowskyi]